MIDVGGAEGIDQPHGIRQPQWPPTPSHAPRPIELWRLRGAAVDVRGLAIETSFGFALGVELDTELVLLLLQRSPECLIDYSNRLEASLLGHGWHRIDECPTESTGKELA